MLRNLGNNNSTKTGHRIRLSGLQHSLKSNRLVTKSQ